MARAVIRRNIPKQTVIRLFNPIYGFPSEEGRRCLALPAASYRIRVKGCPVRSACIGNLIGCQFRHRRRVPADAGAETYPTAANGISRRLWSR